jgi:hypothetical protein
MAMRRSAERRKQASRDAIKRSGAKPGHRVLYGVQVPERLWAALVYDARKFREKHSLESTRSMIRTVLSYL